MTTLQRSSISFRRQGSSGRIWDENSLRVLEVKNGVCGTASPSLMSQELHLPSTSERINVDAKLTENETPNSGLQNSLSCTIPQKRTKKCSLSCIFGRCMRSH